MTKQNTKRNTSISGNRFFILLLSVYFVLLLIVSFLACFFSYQQKREELFAQIDNTYVQLLREYRDITDNFWQVYMPIFESGTDIQNTLMEYFRADSSRVLTPMEKNNLSYALSQMMARDNDVSWIAVYNPNRNDNYILFNNSISLIPLTADFPYYEELNSDSTKMEIYGMEPLTNKAPLINTFAICGGSAHDMGKGKIMAGYSIATMENICSDASTTLKSLNYVLTNKGNILFDHSDKYDQSLTFCSDEEGEDIVTTDDGQKLYVKTQVCGLKTSLVSYYASYWEIFRYCHAYTPLLLLIVLAFAAISVIGYMAMIHMIGKEVSVIRDGLDEIGENHLDYRIPAHFNQSGLPEIAQSINRMAVRLKENINRAYYYELKQKESELSELQSKFNPHFLYNTLEMLRSRCHQSGDESTADLITQLSAIFRGFIGARTFVPMTEELTFSKRYLALFGARYEDKVKIRYDFDKDILKYGIIRNLFQPLIENYFVHGFDTSNEENYILFKGKSLDEERMILTVEDNGSGMTAQEMQELNDKLHEPIKMDTESYGLKNLHQRLQLFYGGDCGLTIYPNPHGGKGLSIQMTARKMTCEEYEESRKRVRL